jgi:hypothetical protein
MMLIHQGEPDIAHPHFFRSCRPIPLIALLHDPSELIVVLPGYDSGGRGRYERGSVEGRALIQVHGAIQRAIEESLISREQVPYGGLHRSPSISIGHPGINMLVRVATANAS